MGAAARRRPLSAFINPSVQCVEVGTGDDEQTGGQDTMTW
jgi:hypothetical protein